MGKQQSTRGSFKPDFKALHDLAYQHAVMAGHWTPGEPTLKGSITRRSGEKWTVELRWRSEGGASRHMWFSASTPEAAWARAEEHLGGSWCGWNVGDFEK